MSVYFCTQTGVRLVAPGVSKTVDPVNGVAPYEGSDPTPPAAEKAPAPPVVEQPPAPPAPEPIPPATPADPTPPAAEKAQGSKKARE